VAWRHDATPLVPKPRDSYFVDWNAIYDSVFPAKAGIQTYFELEARMNLDAGCPPA
jgi:hypothetical protein